MNAKPNEAVGHVTIDDRKSITLDNVVDVLSFDENGVTLSTLPGPLVIEGEELHVKKMDIGTGQVILSGRINGVFYIDRTASPRKGLFGRRK